MPTRVCRCLTASSAAILWLTRLSSSASNGGCFDASTHSFTSLMSVVHEMKTVVSCKRNVQKVGGRSETSLVKPSPTTFFSPPPFCLPFAIVGVRLAFVMVAVRPRASSFFFLPSIPPVAKESVLPNRPSPTDSSSSSCATQQRQRTAELGGGK